jgi:hypothetical protein
METKRAAAKPSIYSSVLPIGPTISD